MGGDALYDCGGGQEDHKGRKEEDGKTLNLRDCGAVSAAVAGNAVLSTGRVRSDPEVAVRAGGAFLVPFFQDDSVIRQRCPQGMSAERTGDHAPQPVPAGMR